MLYSGGMYASLPGSGAGAPKTWMARAESTMVVAMLRVRTMFRVLTLSAMVGAAFSPSQKCSHLMEVHGAKRRLKYLSAPVLSCLCVSFTLNGVVGWWKQRAAIRTP